MAIRSRWRCDIALIASNGAGGGAYSVGASWAGGFVPVLGVDNGQVVAGDTITIDATFGIGDDTAVPALDVLAGGTLDWDNLGNDTCDFQGDFYIRNGGTLTLNGAAAGGNVLIIQLNRSAAPAAGKYGLIAQDGAIINCDGFNKTRSWDTLSADAAAAQANVVTTNDNSLIWNVGDEFVVGSMSTINKAGAETDTIGAFAGGNVITKAGANYASIHEQNVAFINLTRNMVFTSFNVAFQGYIWITNNTPGNVAFDWCEFSYLGLNAANKYGVSVTWQDWATFNYCSFHHCYRGLSSATSTAAVATVNNCVFGLNVNHDIYGIQQAGVLANLAGLGSDNVGFGQTKQHLTDSHVGNCDSHGLFSSATETTGETERCRFYGNGARGVYQGTYPQTFRDCHFDGNGTGLNTASAVNYLRDCSFGTQVANVNNDIFCAGIVRGTGIPNLVLTVVFGAQAPPQSRVSLADIANNHFTWARYGTYEKQNVVVRSGTWAMLMNPNSAAVALTAESTVPASTGLQIVVSAYFRKNAAYGAANLPFLRVSGAGMVTDTATMTDVDDTWQLLVVSGTPTRDAFARVVFGAQSAGGGAAVYVDDVRMVYTAIDTGSQDFWYQGDVAPMMMATGLGAMDVWNVDPATITGAATFGTLAKNLRNIMRFFQAVSGTSS